MSNTSVQTIKTATQILFSQASFLKAITTKSRDYTPLKGFDVALISFASLVAEGNNAGEDQMLFVIPFTPGKYIIIKNCHSSHSNQSLTDINRAGFANLVPMGLRESASPHLYPKV